MEYPLAKPVRHERESLDDALDSILEAYGPTGLDQRGARVLKTLLAETLALTHAGADLGDLKLVATAFSEIRDALDRFAPYKGTRKVTVFGSARSPRESEDYRVAEEFGRRIAEKGFMVITGAGPGIMEAGHRGAGRDKSFGVNIKLPFEQSANEIIVGDDKLMEFKYFFTRKLFFVKEASAIVMFPGGFGTHDEMFECLTLIQTGKAQMMPVICVDSPKGTFWKTWDRYVREHLLRKGLISDVDLDLYSVTDDLDAAVNEITNFYSNYHSERFVRDRLVLRINEPLSQERLDTLSVEFHDLCDNKPIVQRGPLREESDEPDLTGLTRLMLAFDRGDAGKSYGRLRRMIDAINNSNR